MTGEKNAWKNIYMGSFSTSPSALAAKIDWLPYPKLTRVKSFPDQCFHSSFPDTLGQDRKWTDHSNLKYFAYISDLCSSLHIVALLFTYSGTYSYRMTITHSYLQVNNKASFMSSSTYHFSLLKSFFPTFHTFSVDFLRHKLLLSPLPDSLASKFPFSCTRSDSWLTIIMNSSSNSVTLIFSVWASS